MRSHRSRALGLASFRLLRRFGRWLPALLLATFVLTRSLPGSAGSPLDLLPESLRERGVAVLAEADPARRASGLTRLARLSGEQSTAFLLAALESDPSPVVRERIVRALGERPLEQVLGVLEKRAASDPDDAVALAALESLHTATAAGLERIAGERLARATPQSAALLREAHERWQTLAHGALLPGFLREPPPLFEVVAPDRPVRFAAFGDFGRGSEGQHRVADAIARYHARDALDFGITLGDNFYPLGVKSPRDPLWQSLWSELYDRLRIPFYASLGNHDWGRPDSPAAEVLFTRPGGSWQLPATRYAFRAGPAQLFALDTTALSDAQLDWLARELPRSDAPWKIVYGHHPIRSAARRGDNGEMLQRLLPVLAAGRVQLYLAGHDHHMEHVAPEQGVQLFIVGSGGAELRPVTAAPNTLFSASTYGFAVVRASAEKLAVDLIDADLQVLHSASWARETGAD